MQNRALFPPRGAPISLAQSANRARQGQPSGGDSPMRILRRKKRTDRQLDRRECEVDAELAAEMACDAASLAIEWAQRAGVAADDAVEGVGGPRRGRERRAAVPRGLRATAARGPRAPRRGPRPRARSRPTSAWSRRSPRRWASRSLFARRPALRVGARLARAHSVP